MTKGIYTSRFQIGGKAHFEPDAKKVSIAGSSPTAEPCDVTAVKFTESSVSYDIRLRTGECREAVPSINVCDRAP